MPQTRSKRPASSLNSPLFRQKSGQTRDASSSTTRTRFESGRPTLLDLAKIIHSEEDAAIFLIEQGVIEVSGSGYGRRGTHKAGHTQGGAHTRRCTQKAVNSSAGVLLFKGGAGAGPRVERNEPYA